MSTPPAAPENVRQGELLIIGVECLWDLPEPASQVQLQLWYDGDTLYDEVLSGDATERLLGVPMASTDYLLRVRAGNQAGWSDWAEATVSTMVYPVIDSRTGVLAATYMEEAVYPDTWNGGSTDAGGQVEQLLAGAEVSVDGYALERTYRAQSLGVGGGVGGDDDSGMVSEAVLDHSATLDITMRALQFTKHAESNALLDHSATLSAELRTLRFSLSQDDGVVSHATMSHSAALDVELQTMRSETFPESNAVMSHTAVIDITLETP